MTMEIQGYANTKDGYHVCVDCTTDEEKGVFTPLGLSDLYEYKYADYDHGSADDFNQPSCDRCHKPIKAEGGSAEATELDKIASRVIKNIHQFIPPRHHDDGYYKNRVLDALGRQCKRATHQI